MISDNAAINLARLLKEYCILQLQDNCKGCVFNNGEEVDYCLHVQGSIPKYWGLKQKDKAEKGMSK